MLKVGIYVDYKHNDTTLAAVMLANWMLRLGNSVKVISNGPVARNVDCYWDDRVIRDSNKSLKLYENLTHAFWFYPDRLTFLTAKFVGENTERASELDSHIENLGKTSTLNHVYFPGWCSKEVLFGELLLNSKAICLNRDSALWLSSKCKDFEVDRNWSTLCSADKLLVPKQGKVDKDKVKMLVLLGSDFSQDIGNELISTFEALLKKHETLKVTFLLEKSLPKVHKSRLNRLKLSFKDRVVLAGVMPYSQYHAMAYLHDWVYLACASFKHGALIPHLAVSGTPLICHDIPPARSYISGGLSGMLVPTVVSNTFNPRGIVCFKALATTLSQAINMNDLGLKGLQKNTYSNHKKQAQEFARFLSQELS